MRNSLKKKDEGMDIKVYRYFTALARTKNYARAAKELYITPQGLSSSIKRLESSLEVPLFDSKSGSIELTEYGTILYRRVRSILREHDEMQEEIRSLYRRKSGRILLSASTGIFNVIPREAVRNFNKTSKTGAHVDVSRTVVDYDCETSLIERTCDFALLNDPVDHSVLASIPLQKDMMFLWAPADSPLAGKDELDIRDLDGLTISCVTSQEFKTSRKNESILHEHAPHCTLLYEDEMISVVEAALRNRGYALLPRVHALAFQRENHAAIPVRNLDWGFSIAYRADRTLSPQDEEFLDFMKSYQRFYC